MASSRVSLLQLLPLLLPLFLLLAGSAEGGSFSNQVSKQVRDFFNQISKVWNQGGNAASLFVCLNSTLPGYISSYKLSDGLTIHWVPAKNTSELQIAVEARRLAVADSSSSSPDNQTTSQALPGKGWFAVGWSQTGAMYPGDAVVGNQQRTLVAGYSMTGHEASAVRRTNDMQLGKTSLSRSGSSVIMKFSRFEDNAGVVPFSIRGYGIITWAYAADGTKVLGSHDSNRGFAEVDFSCDAAAPPPPPRPSSSSPGQNCKKSALDGYQYQASLQGSSLLLHWKAAVGKEVEMAVEAKAGSAASDGWMSLAWSSSSGRMVPSDAVAGNLPNGEIYAYKVSGYSTGSVKRGGFEIGSQASTKTEGGSIVMRFTRTDNTGWSNQFRLSGKNSLIWAYSSSGSNTLGSHGGNYGRLSVDFSCRTAPAAGRSNFWWWPRRFGRGGGGGGGDDD
ncbi:hypothetical protein CLOM_g4395 [Closterium sp. NIES-68]|nr:hypothetical protein CLOM_g4395 [Closterium sp. NIES-68]GJP86957.1 hypothetical protein CLOP_g16917 [Closterium sp. NIES-67]